MRITFLRVASSSLRLKTRRRLTGADGFFATIRASAISSNAVNRSVNRPRTLCSRRIGYPAPPLDEQSAVILWGGEFALEVPPCGLPSRPPALQPRCKLRYPSDLTDAEWARVEPLIPPGNGSRLVVIRRFAIRQVTNCSAVHSQPSVASDASLPKDLPPRRLITSDCGTGIRLARIHHALDLKCREKAAIAKPVPTPSSSTARV